MKKVLFTIAAMAACMTASAQLWVAGSVNLGNQSYWNNEDSRTNWGINPTIGYALDDALEVGLDFGISGSTQGDNKPLNFSIAPFARYTFFTDGDFSMYLQGAVSYGFYKHPTTDDKDTTFGISIQPGIKYTLTDNFALVAGLGSLSFNHNNPKGPSAGPQNGFGLNLSTALDFGLVYSF